MSDKTLYSAVLINSGELTNNTLLFPRELFIKSNGQLVIGKIDEPAGTEPNARPMHISVQSAYMSHSVEYSKKSGDREIASVQLTNENSTMFGVDIGGCFIGSGEQLNFGGNYIKNEDGALKMSLGGTSTIDGGMLNENTISQAKLNLSDACYGSQQKMMDIQNPQKGDIFIVI